MMINVNDRFTTGLPAVVDLASPTATYQTPGAMIYPFKKMTGNQPADKNTFTVLVPNLFGNATTDPDAYWVSFDWAKALATGSAYTGQTYSGEFVFVDTVMLLKVDHEVAPREMAYGQCDDCHGGTQIDWAALPPRGRTFSTDEGSYVDQLIAGTRPEAEGPLLPPEIAGDPR